MTWDPTIPLHEKCDRLQAEKAALLHAVATAEALVMSHEGHIAQLEAALRKLFGFLEDGTLVRDISHDLEPHWAMRQLPLVQTLTEVKALLTAKEPG